MTRTKITNRIVSFVLAAIFAVLLIPTNLFDLMETEAATLKTIKVGPAQGYTVTYTNASATYATYNNSGYVLNTSKTTRSSSGTFKFYVTRNYGNVDRVSYIYLRNASGQTVQALKIVQEKVFITVTPSVSKSVVSGNGEIMTATVVANTKVTFGGFGATSARPTVSKSSFGYDATKYGNRQTNTVTITFPKNDTLKTRMIGFGGSGSPAWCESFQFTQYPSATFYTKANSENPFGRLNYQGYSYKIWPEEMSGASGWTKVKTVKDEKYGFDVWNLADLELTDDNGSVNPFTVGVDLLNIVYNAADNYFITFDFYKSNTTDERRVVIKGTDNGAQRFYNTYAGTTIKKTISGKKYEFSFDSQHNMQSNWFLWIDENSQHSMSVYKLPGDSYKVDGYLNLFGVGYQEPTTGTTFVPGVYYSPFPIAQMYDEYKDLMIAVE